MGSFCYVSISVILQTAKNIVFQKCYDKFSVRRMELDYDVMEVFVPTTQFRNLYIQLMKTSGQSPRRRQCVHSLQRRPTRTEKQSSCSANTLSSVYFRYLNLGNPLASDSLTSQYQRVQAYFILFLLISSTMRNAILLIILSENYT